MTITFRCSKASSLTQIAVVAEYSVKDSNDGHKLSSKILDTFSAMFMYNSSTRGYLERNTLAPWQWTALVVFICQRDSQPSDIILWQKISGSCNSWLGAWHNCTYRGEHEDCALAELTQSAATSWVPTRLYICFTTQPLWNCTATDKYLNECLIR